MLYEAIKNFNKQFEYRPEIKNGAKLAKFDKFIVVGMGGSHLAADMLKIWNPYLKLIVHRDYGLPSLPDEELEKSLIILSSYSGNTEEVLDAYKTAKEKNLPCAAVSIGGKLIELAEKNSDPYIQIPDTGIQPRMATGFMFAALLKIIDEKVLEQISELAGSLAPADYEKKGRDLANKLKGFIPVIYSSERNFPLAYNWKIAFNENAKIPAFCNVLPELNHNEMTGFDVKDATRFLSEKFYFIFLKDFADDSRVLKRMEVLKKLYVERGLPVEIAEIGDKNVFHKIFSIVILGALTAYHIAKLYEVETEQVPMVEEFKKLIKDEAH